MVCCSMSICYAGSSKSNRGRNFSAPPGIREFKLDDIKLPAGIYLVKIKSGWIDYGFRKLMISGN